MVALAQGPFVVYMEKLHNCADVEMDKSRGHYDMQVRASHWNPMRPTDAQILNGYVDLVNLTIDDQKWVRLAHAQGRIFSQL